MKTSLTRKQGHKHSTTVLQATLVLTPLFILAAAFYGKSIFNTGVKELGMPQAVIQTESRLQSVDIAPDGKSLLVSGYNEKKNVVFCKTIDAVSGAVLRSFVELRVPGALTSVKFAPDGQAIAFSNSSYGFQIFDVASGRALLSQKDVYGNPAFSADGRYVATDRARPDFHLSTLIQDRKTGKVLHALTSTTWGEARKSFSPDGQFLATVSAWKIHFKKTPESFGVKRNYAWLEGGQPQLWNVKTGRLVRSFAANGALSLSFSPNGEMIAISNKPYKDKNLKEHPSTVFLFDVRTGRLLWEKSFYEANRDVTDVLFLHSGRSLAVQNTKYEVAIVNADSGQVERNLKTNAPNNGDSFNNNLSLSANGELLASRTKDSIRIWNVKGW